MSMSNTSKDNKHINDTKRPPPKPRKPIHNHGNTPKRNITNNEKTKMEKSSGCSATGPFKELSDVEDSLEFDETSDIEESNFIEKSFTIKKLYTSHTKCSIDNSTRKQKSFTRECKGISKDPSQRKHVPNADDKIESSLERSSDSTQGIGFGFLILFISLAILMAYSYISKSELPTELNSQSNNKKTTCSFVKLKKSFPRQNDNLWNEITIGIEGILNNNPTIPGVYLFLHENNEITKNLIENIANTSSNCFDPNLQPIRLQTEDFISNDYGTIIEKYKENMKDGGVLVVANLNEIPPESAKALHAICDSYSPIVERVIIFLTLTVNSDDEGKPLEIAENKLNDLWGSTIKQNELEPLISRVTDSVLRLHSE